MKILHINTVDTSGGAARAAYRLHRALLNAHVDSQMLVRSKNSDDYTVIQSAQNKLDKVLNIVRPVIDEFLLNNYPNRNKTLFSPAYAPFSNIAKRVEELNPDVVHLHWICGSYFPIEDLLKIKKPLVWSLHDNWAFTGGCHIKWECEKYTDSCGQCPRLGSGIENDLSRKVFLRKQSVFNQLPNLKIIGLSNWVSECTKRSLLLKSKEVITLPNTLNTDLYSPVDKTLARTLLNLPLNKKLVMFGAMNATSDINKGFNQLLEALNQLTDDIELVVFGSSQPEQALPFKQHVHYLGHLYDDPSLRLVYSAADVMVVPSLQENLSNAIMESLACQTPVVAFDVGGNQDLILHKKNGYLAKSIDVTDLANGMNWVLAHENPSYLANNAREHVVGNFSCNIVVPKYIDLYQTMLKHR